MFSVSALSNIPWNEDVVALATELNGKWSEAASGRSLTLEMDATSAPKIRKLAEAIRKVTGRGRRYDNCNWKWITRRTAASLQRFADSLQQYRHMHRSSRPTSRVTGSVMPQKP